MGLEGKGARVWVVDRNLSYTSPWLDWELVVHSLHNGTSPQDVLNTFCDCFDSPSGIIGVQPCLHSEMHWGSVCTAILTPFQAGGCICHTIPRYPFGGLMKDWNVLFLFPFCLRQPDSHLSCFMSVCAYAKIIKIFFYFSCVSRPQTQLTLV